MKNRTFDQLIRETFYIWLLFSSVLIFLPIRLPTVFGSGNSQYVLPLIKAQLAITIPQLAAIIGYWFSDQSKRKDIPVSSSQVIAVRSVTIFYFAITMTINYLVLYKQTGADSTKSPVEVLVDSYTILIPVQAMAIAAISWLTGSKNLDAATEDSLLPKIKDGATDKTSHSPQESGLTDKP